MANAQFIPGRCRDISRLKAELHACSICTCAGCARRGKVIAERLADLEAVAPPPPPPESPYDQMFLAMGVEVPKAKRSRQFTRAHKIAAGKQLFKIIRFSRTTEGIAREQTRMDRIWRARGHTVRG